MSTVTGLSKPALEVSSPGWLTAVVMAATVMQVLDSTIANIALPQMTAGLSASQDEITWVLTSYIVAAAIATPLTGWATDRIGRRNVFLGAIAGFTVALASSGRLRKNRAAVVTSVRGSGRLSLMNLTI